MKLLHNLSNIGIEIDNRCKIEKDQKNDWTKRKLEKIKNKKKQSKKSQNAQIGKQYWALPWQMETRTSNQKQFWNMPRNPNAAEAVQQVYQSIPQNRKFYQKNQSATKLIFPKKNKNRNFNQQMDTKEFTSNHNL